MLTRKSPRNAALTITAILALSSTACSEDGSGDEAEAAGSDASVVADATPDPDSDNAVGGQDSAPDSDSAYGSDLKILGSGLQAGTGADSFTVDGHTLRLHFSDGSVDEPSADIACSAALQLLDAEHQAIMVYPDGEKDCTDIGGAPGDGAADVAGGSGAASASLTIGDHSWEFGQVVCAFGLSCDV